MIMDAKITRINEHTIFLHAEDNGYPTSGYAQAVGVDYAEQEKNTTVSINGSPFLRRDDPELKKYQFPKHNPKLKVYTLTTITPHYSTES
jgi:hypothetical protein